MRGFSLVEALMALLISSGIAIAIFQLFQQNERSFRDQHLVIEMHQIARAVASQIGDEVRMAGEGIPLFASTFDNNNSEAVTAILASSTANRIDFRAGLSNTETNVTSAIPIDFTLGIPRTVNVGDGSQFSKTLGTTAPTGKFVYFWGPASPATWAWIRAELTQVSSNSLTITPRQGGDAGRSPGADSVLGTADDGIRFLKPPTVSLEEAVSFSFSGDAVKRATAANMTNPAAPTWSAANEIGRNVVSISFTYYDQNNRPIPAPSLTSLVNRASIARVDLRLAVQTANTLTNGARPSYLLAQRMILRNTRLR
jgi:type II secretory pathway pseudopilin PulG